MPMGPMRMPLLPVWLRVVWVVGLCVVAILHIWHARAMSGQGRWWHIGHTLMATGMVVMYVVGQAGHAGLYWGGVAVFGAFAVGTAGVGTVLWRRERTLDWRWTASTVDMAAMACMALPSDVRGAVVAYLFVAYLGVEMLVWLAYPLPRRAVRHMQVPAMHAPIMSAAGSGGDLGAGGVLTQAPRQQAVMTPGSCESARSAADVTLDVRLTLVVMAASMAWMFVAMQTMQMPLMH